MPPPSIFSFAGSAASNSHRHSLAAGVSPRPLSHSLSPGAGVLEFRSPVSLQILQTEYSPMKPACPLPLFPAGAYSGKKMESGTTFADVVASELAVKANGVSPSLTRPAETPVIVSSEEPRTKAPAGPDTSPLKTSSSPSAPRPKTAPVPKAKQTAKPKQTANTSPKAKEAPKKAAPKVLSKTTGTPKSKATAAKARPQQAKGGKYPASGTNK
uniref:Uncharacterized protein n=1 Tax=Chromera velia CCMP2878 TaxID=1169474 RepID=A0A0G4HDR2_9ALVE|eukprot:Cvel_26389.t1-p1 / transcript=Cvel_26389.t1 / gene=Cvel_26389 / organism=Chromera_velia_CCMP2878 / gene_product=hypothetical protein / transcript_product=hypothetical protein / location=Cvel_scaffold3130:17964-19798(-) / protein_length=212 / sequence_SO=supercontig / SO=protein_coding / is_pseudo=false